jgi:hypothetical protein
MGELPNIGDRQGAATGEQLTAVGPCNDHELEIAREVDKMSERDYLGPDVVPEILAFLDFKVSATDYEFLQRYMQWRMENPIVK